MDESRRPLAKAAGFNSVVASLRDGLLDAEAFAKVVGKLTPETAAAIKTPPLSVQWIPCERYGDLVSSALPPQAYAFQSTLRPARGRRRLAFSDSRAEVSYEKIVAVYPGFWSYQRGCLLAAVQATGYSNATAVQSRADRRGGNAMFTIDWS